MEIQAREAKGKRYGTVVLAEGIAEYLPDEFVPNGQDGGYLNLRKMNLAGIVARRTAERYAARTGQSMKVTGVQLGYESRCAPPHAFDVLLGCQLGLGAYRALVERKLNGCMVSVSGQLDLRYVPFSDLVDGSSLKPKVRFIDRNSDFFHLAARLGTQVESLR